MNFFQDSFIGTRVSIDSGEGDCLLDLVKQESSRRSDTAVASSPDRNERTEREDIVKNFLTNQIRSGKNPYNGHANTAEFRMMQKLSPKQTKKGLEIVKNVGTEERNKKFYHISLRSKIPQEILKIKYGN